jgi:hypothetical protein
MNACFILFYCCTVFVCLLGIFFMYIFFAFASWFSLEHLVWIWSEKLSDSAIFQLYHGENKLIVNELTMKSDLYYTNTLTVVGFYIASSLKQQSVDRHVTPLRHIILIWSQPVGMNLGALIITACFFYFNILFVIWQFKIMMLRLGARYQLMFTIILPIVLYFYLMFFFKSFDIR